MDFIEWLKNQEAECIEFARDINSRTNQADIVATNNRLNRISTALNLLDEYNKRG